MVARLITGRKQKSHLTGGLWLQLGLKKMNTSVRLGAKRSRVADSRRHDGSGGLGQGGLCKRYVCVPGAVAQHQLGRIDGEGERGGLVEGGEAENLARARREHGCLDVVDGAAADAQLIDRVDRNNELGTVGQNCPQFFYILCLFAFLQRIQRLFVDGHIARAGIDHELAGAEIGDLGVDVIGSSSLVMHGYRNVELARQDRR